jgi:UPF0716 family protein affecting phage T7 exclusion
VSAVIAGILGAIPGEVWSALGALLVGVVGAWVQKSRGRSQGRRETITELEELDKDEAEEVRRRLDHIDREHSTVERLRRLGRWRG